MSDVIYTDPNGKNWRVVEVRGMQRGDFVIDGFGYVFQATAGHTPSVRTIVEQVLPPRRVPTDQDAAVWPRRKCWVRGLIDRPWMEATLLAVKGDMFFASTTEENADLWWRYCEIDDTP